VSRPLVISRQSPVQDLQLFVYTAPSSNIDDLVPIVVASHSQTLLADLFSGMTLDITPRNASCDAK